jgi:hypothetical protein
MSSDALSYRQPALYWTQLVQMKVSAEYIQLYRDGVGRSIWWFDVTRALTSSGAVAAWAVVQTHLVIWGTIIALAQVSDVVKGTLPLTKHYDAACQLSTSLNALFIDVTFEWEAITAGRLNEEEISAARRRIMTIGHDLQTKHFPGGLKRRAGLLRLAEVATARYLEATFHVETLR